MLWSKCHLWVGVYFNICPLFLLNYKEIIIRGKAKNFRDKIMSFQAKQNLRSMNIEIHIKKLIF